VRSDSCPQQRLTQPLAATLTYLNSLTVDYAHPMLILRALT
jgi:hypothetical protein